MTGSYVPHFLPANGQFQTCPIVRNEPLARDTYRVRIECPEIARCILPGQFVMLRFADVNDPLLGRPLALYDTFESVDGTVLGIDLVYLVTGKLTRRLASSAPGALVDLWGPLGNGFSSTECGHLVLVAGGIGHTPFLAAARSANGIKAFGDEPRRSWASTVTLCYGARTAAYLSGLPDFEAAGVRIRVATDDGSRGHHGLVTDLLPELLSDGSSRVMCCGPDAMMAAVARICAEHRTPCEVSLETPMACGIGACFTCVAPVRDPQGDSWDYKRTCVEGPVFDAQCIAWDA